MAVCFCAVLCRISCYHLCRGFVRWR